MAYTRSLWVIILGVRGTPFLGGAYYGDYDVAAALFITLFFACKAAYNTSEEGDDDEAAKRAKKKAEESKKKPV